MRVSVREFVSSRWLPWSLFTLALSFGGLHADYYKIKKEKEKLSYELAQTEWALKNVSKRKRRVEEKPDGSRTVIEEYTKSESETSSIKKESLDREREAVVLNCPSFGVGINSYLGVSDLSLSAGPSLSWSVFGPLSITSGMGFAIDGSWQLRQFSLGLEYKF